LVLLDNKGRRIWVAISLFVTWWCYLYSLPKKKVNDDVPLGSPCAQQCSHFLPQSGYFQPTKM
jgi:hypothetical protein